MSYSGLWQCFLLALIIFAGCEASRPEDASGQVYKCGEREPASGKLWQEEYLRTNPASAYRLAITLELDPSPQFHPPCALAAAAPNCDERDAWLKARELRSLTAIACVFRELGARAGASVLWYEDPMRSSSGKLIPIPTMLEVLATWSQAEGLATLSEVKSIALAPGRMVGGEMAVPEPPAECPNQFQDDPQPKLSSGIEGEGLRPIVVDLRQIGFPDVRSCPGGSELCDEAVSDLWERAIRGRRHLTCLLRLMDQKVGKLTRVGYVASAGNLSAPGIPPLGEPAVSVVGLGFGLEYDDILAVAKHPFVERIWTGPGIQIVPETALCTPDLTGPILRLDCPNQREPTAGKISADDARLLRGKGKHRVLVTVRDGAQPCQLPECPTGGAPCPAREQFIARWTAENTEAQHCVRTLIESIGGWNSPDVFWLVNAFEAELTASQVDEVASHPHVSQIARSVISF